MNYLAILVAAVAAMVIGFIWYGPLFGKTWLKLKKISREEIEATKAKGQKGMAKEYLWTFIASFVTAWVLAYLGIMLDVTTTVDALMLAFWIWLGFIVTTNLNSVLWEKAPLKLYFINIFHHLGAFAAMSLIVNLWR